MEKQYNILIIESSVIIATGLKSIISKYYPMASIFYAESIHDGIHMGTHKFDVILVDTLMFSTGKPIFQKLFAYFRDTPMIGIVSSYYSKELYNNFQSMIDIHESEESIISSLEAVFTTDEANEQTISATNILSDRERDVLKLLVNGHSNKEIAEKLFISVHTVATHRKNITAKTGIKSTAAMAIYAVANNIIDIQDSIQHLH
jgi:DNA-binding NarL/FixJ family response regulator